MDRMKVRGNGSPYTSTDGGGAGAWPAGCFVAGTTDTFVVNGPTASWLAGQPSTSTTARPRYPFMGLLTHPATLIAISNAVFGSTVSRGQFIASQFQRCVADHVIRFGLQHTEYPPELVQTVLDGAIGTGPAITFRTLIKALVRQPIFSTR